MSALTTREENIFMARLAEQAERYDDMLEYMKRVASMGTELSIEERNLFSVAYKNSVACRRQAWRAVSTIEASMQQTNPDSVGSITNYRANIEAELNTRCHDVLDILTRELIPRASTAESQVFYMKMKGDYNRYRAEFSPAGNPYAQEALECYKSASEAAQQLGPCDSIRLGLALNFSVFYYEVYQSPREACALAKETYDQAIDLVSQLSQEQYQEAAQILQLLKDNLMLWQQSTGDVAAAQMDGTRCEDF
jgi:14-3-3 protein epsilon